MELSTPFANTGDREDFDETASGTGDMSLEKGFTSFFELKPEEGGLFIARKKLNQLLYLISAKVLTKQDEDATLTALSGLTTSADKLIYATGSDAFATTTLTAFARTLLDDTDASTMRSTLSAALQSDIGTSSTASGTAAKTVTITGIAALVSGMTIQVKFTNANTATAPTLNVNSLGAKSIISEDGTLVSATNPFYVPAGATVEFVYNGTYWMFKNKIVTNYVNGTEWYRQYTNGWIEQGGVIAYTTTGASLVISLLKAHKDTNYIFNRAGKVISTSASNAAYNTGYTTKTTSTVTIFSENVSSVASADWQTAGF